MLPINEKWLLLVILAACSFQRCHLSKSLDSSPNVALLRNMFQNASFLLSSHEACKSELKSLCGDDPEVLENNLAILNCIAEHSEEDAKLSPKCQHQIWTFKYNITNLDYFTTITQTLCKPLLVENKDCLEAENDVLSPGANLLSCLIERIQPETNFGCKTYLKEMELIIFSDYKLVHKFTNLCQSHIAEFKCGRLEQNDEKSLHSQTNTIECLQEHIDKLSQMCKHEILRISELQSDDFHLDKPLYFACRTDREHLCANIQSGNGRVYKCLLQNKQATEMSEDCRNKLIQRERLVLQDYKVSRSLVHSCKSDIKRYQCREGTSDRKEIRLAQILLCLENAYTKSLPIAPDCYSEMLLHRRTLLQDHKLTPNLVDACQHDIDEFCSNAAFGGNMLHCLMKFAKTKRHRGDAHMRKRISPKCQREIEILLKEVNVAQDWRVDPVLQEACQSTVNTLCLNIQPGNGRILSCLAEHIESSQMEDECRQSLLQMQYFVARNFELDSQIYEACHADAVKHCHAKRDWYDDQEHMDPERGPTVMACLYRYVYHRDASVALSKDCIHNVKRIMKQRATNVDLMPFIEEPCIQDLAKFCSSTESVDKKGYEMVCLQDNYEQLQLPCRAAIGNFTEAQSSHFELNFPLLKYCTSLAKDMCPQEYESFLEDEQGEVVECLIRHKNTYQIKGNRKCRTAIEHYQLINMKDFQFDSKFKKACKGDVFKHCNNIHSKSEVVRCLSTLIYNDTISLSKRRVSRECKNLLRVELLQINEDINLDHTLAEACRVDREQYCADVESGEAHVLECLQNNMVKLKKACQRQLFQKQYIELADNSVDYSLLSICKGAISRYCFSSDLSSVLYCLRDHRNERGISNNCRSLILRRLLQQNQDYRLNPRLKSGCKKEIKKYCQDIIIKRKPDELLDGKVISCLKKQYLLSSLSQSCEVEVVNIIREVSLNIELDPVLFRKCQNEIGKNCADNLDNDIQECLKNKFMQKKLEDVPCKHEVARLIRETETDLESDPHLFKVCIQDLKSYCADVLPGGGQQLNCLTAIQRTTPRKLSQECDTMLLKRLQLFEYAAEIYPADSVAKVIQMVANSPVHNSLYSAMLSLFLFVFMFGIFCGRFAIRRVATSDKIK